MSYTITTTAGQTLATIADGTVNSTNTSLTLIGKNYAGYGIFLNENYIKLLENFNNTTAPNAPLTGQLWYDGSNSVLKVYTGNQWKPISSSATGTTAPSSAVTVLGDLWYDTQNAQLKVFGGSSWITIGPSYTTTSGTSGAVVETITDALSTSHIAVKFYISNTVVAILSKDTTAYTPSPGISGFTTIKPGLNLVSSSTIAGAQFTGDASNALSLQGVNASSFLRSDVAASTIYQLSVASLVVNSGLTLSVSGGDASITNTSLGKSIFLNVNRTSGGPTNVLTVNGSTGLVSLTNALTVAGITTLSSTTAASSSTTGALVVGGGVGIAGAVFTAGALNVQSATASSSTSTGALIVTGGAGVGGNIWALGFNTAGAATVNSANIQATTASTNTATGALRVMGGVGVAGTLSAGALNITGAVGFGSNIIAGLAQFAAINSTAIGNASPSTGAFTTLTATGNVIAGLGQFAAINATPIGNASASTGSFTTIAASSTAAITGNLSAGSLTIPGSAHTLTGNATVTGNLTVNGTIIGGTRDQSNLNLGSQAVGYSTGQSVTSASLVDVTGLVATTQAGKVYRYEAYIPHSAGASLIKAFAVKFSSTNSSVYYTVEQNVAYNGASSVQTLTGNVIATGAGSTGASAANLHCRITGTISGAGHVQIMAQTSTNTLTIHPGAHMILTRIG